MHSVFDVGGNTLGGPIPDSISLLTALTYVTLAADADARDSALNSELITVQPELVVFLWSSTIQVGNPAVLLVANPSVFLHRGRDLNVAQNYFEGPFPTSIFTTLTALECVNGFVSIHVQLEVRDSDLIHVQVCIEKRLAGLQVGPTGSC